MSKDEQQRGGLVLFGDVASGVKLPGGRGLKLRPSARQVGHHSSDDAEAIAWYRRAAEQGDASAQGGPV